MSTNQTAGGNRPLKRTKRASGDMGRFPQGHLRPTTGDQPKTAPAARQVPANGLDNSRGPAKNGPSAQKPAAAVRREREIVGECQCPICRYGREGY